MQQKVGWGFTDLGWANFFFWVVDPGWAQLGDSASGIGPVSCQWVSVAGKFIMDSV